MYREILLMTPDRKWLNECKWSNQMLGWKLAEVKENIHIHFQTTNMLADRVLNPFDPTNDYA